MESLFNNINYIAPDKKTITELEASTALREAYKRIFNKYPSNESLACLWAKTKHETGNFKVGFMNFNFGNKKSKSDNELFTMFKCGEEISIEQANSFVKETPDLVKIVSRYKKNGKDWASVTILPGHPWSKFTAYKTLEDGAEKYIRFLCESKRYTKAWQKVIDGNPSEFSHELHEAGYYTANKTNYTKGVVANFNNFMKRVDELVVETIPETLRSEENKNIDLTNVPDIELPVFIDSVTPEKLPVVTEKTILLTEEQKQNLTVKGDLSIMKVENEQTNIFLVFYNLLISILSFFFGKK